ncbi:DUF6069 family protein [Actinomadura sp. 7K534]|uniref:DUF6069 family protein n=1 Tax=Actinomadura sp. 7K534 TaxID=2530366 RepID=UPI001A9FC142|nr:DUF6069 family protein [Actinomadura sp. 7K534]
MSIRTQSLGVAGAVAAALAVWAVGEPLLGHDLVVEQPGKDATDLGAGAFATFSLAASLLGWALLAVLERVTAHGLRIWTVAALAVLALSFFPLTGVEASAGAKTVLALAHVAVAAVLIPAFRYRPPQRRRAGESAEDGEAVGSR